MKRALSAFQIPGGEICGGCYKNRSNYWSVTKDIPICDECSNKKVRSLPNKKEWYMNVVKINEKNEALKRRNTLVPKKIFKITGYFGYWGAMGTIQIEARTYKEATTNLKEKVMKVVESHGKGANQRTFYCTVLGYEVITLIKSYKEFKNPQKFS